MSPSARLIPDQLRWAAEHHPDEIGFTVVGAGDLTLGDWHARSSRVARGLVGLGVRPGDRVALALTPQDGLAFVVGYAAAHKAGAVAVPVNVRLSPREFVGILRHCEPAVVVVSDSLRHLVTDLAEPRPTIVTVGAAGGGELGWESLLDEDAADLQVPRDPEDLAEILYTSGTTRTPKGVAVRHCNSALFVYAEPAWSGRVWVHASPMFTMSGLTFVYQPMRMGMRTVYQPKFDTRQFHQLVRDYQPQACFLVPAMIELLLADEETKAVDLSCIELVSIGSAPIAPSTLTEFQQLVPQAAVSNSYSMTEAGTAYFVMPKGELANHPGSVGQPVPPAEVRIVDDNGADVPTGTVGHVQVKPAGRMREYYREPDASKEVFAADGWLRTGDLGRFDDDGFLYIAGRAKDVIIRGGLKVHASDVEAALYEHDAVQEAAVVGAPHRVLGEDVAAFVVLRDGAQCEATELIDFCRQRLADYMAPRRIHFREALPRNATGKVLKRDLVAELAESAQPAATAGGGPSTRSATRAR
ncbi:MAG TPA: class I adenylate-forming enzyme family protein [Mycobacteriales bacterium]|nr:class I adenylate-forming enzyme family protein [Mycobacteriales bacterium]